MFFVRMKVCAYCMPSATKIESAGTTANMRFECGASLVIAGAIPATSSHQTTSKYCFFLFGSRQSKDPREEKCSQQDAYFHILLYCGRDCRHLG